MIKKNRTTTFCRTGLSKLKCICAPAELPCIRGPTHDGARVRGNIIRACAPTHKRGFRAAGSEAGDARSRDHVQFAKLPGARDRGSGPRSGHTRPKGAVARAPPRPALARAFRLTRRPQDGHSAPRADPRLSVPNPAAWQRPGVTAASALPQSIPHSPVPLSCLTHTGTHTLSLFQ